MKLTSAAFAIPARLNLLDAGRDIARGLSQFTPLHTTLMSAREIRDRLIDRALHIDTAPPRSRKSVANAMFNDSVFYEATDYMLLRRYIKPLKLSSADVVYEIGCGVGRAVCAFARRPRYSALRPDSGTVRTTG